MKGDVTLHRRLSLAEPLPKMISGIPSPSSPLAIPDVITTATSGRAITEKQVWVHVCYIKAMAFEIKRYARFDISQIMMYIRWPLSDLVGLPAAGWDEIILDAPVLQLFLDWGRTHAVGEVEEPMPVTVQDEREQRRVSKEGRSTNMIDCFKITSG